MPASRSRTFQFLLAALLFLVLEAALLGADYEGKRVQVKMNDGRTLEGLIVAEEPSRLRIQLRFGVTWLRRSDIVSIDVLLSFSEMFEKRAGECKTADDWVELARWCQRYDIGLESRVAECLEKAIQLDPEHVRARELRGDIRIGGKWYGEKEGNEKLGRVKVNGEWVSKERAEELEKLEKLKKNKALQGFLEELEAREGRPWASVDYIETPHYLVKCNSTEKVARQYSLLLEDLYDAYTEMFPTTEFPRLVEEKGRVFIFRNRDEFMDFNLGPTESAGGYYAPWDRAVRAYHGSFGVTGSTEEVLAHEVTHQFQGVIMRNMMTVPKWLIEGMAVYYGDGTKFTPGGVKLHGIPHERLKTLKQAIRTGRYDPLKKMFMYNAPTPIEGYHQGWGVIYWCLQGEKYGAHDGGGKKVWDEYLRHVCSDAMPSIYNVNLQEHYAKERDYFISLITRHTRFKTIEEWEESYKDFILNTLELEALGTWKGFKWTGKTVGIQEVTFPRAGGLRKVETEDLHPEYDEVAAVENKNGTRVWLAVTGNSGIDVNAKLLESRGQALLYYYFIPDGTPKLEIGNYQGSDNLLVVQARFTGKFQMRVESGVSGGNQPEDKKGTRATSSASSFDPSQKREIRVSMIITPDKVFMFCLTGTGSSFFKLETAYEEFFRSARLMF